LEKKEFCANLSNGLANLETIRPVSRLSSGNTNPRQSDWYSPAKKKTYLIMSNPKFIKKFDGSEGSFSIRARFKLLAAKNTLIIPRIAPASK